MSRQTMAIKSIQHCSVSRDYSSLVCQWHLWMVTSGNCDMCMGSSTGPVFSNIWESAMHGINHYPMAKR